MGWVILAPFLLAVLAALVLTWAAWVLVKLTVSLAVAIVTALLAALPRSS
jgi:hypothetical protein